MVELTKLEPTFSLPGKKRIFEFKDNGDFTEDTLDVPEKQLALALLKQDEKKRSENELELTDPAQKQQNIVVERTGTLPDKVLTKFHKHLMHAYGEVEVMNDTVQRMIRTMRKDPETPQQLSFVGTIPSNSNRTPANSALLDRRQESAKRLAYKWKKVKYGEISGRLREMSRQLNKKLDRDDQIFSQMAFPLKERGWLVGRNGGRLSIWYGLSDDQSVPLSDIKVPERHRDKILSIKWEFNSHDDLFHYGSACESMDIQSQNEDQIMVDVLFDDSGTKKPSDNQNSDVGIAHQELEQMLKSARQSVLDEVLYMHLHSDIRTLPLSIVKDRSIIYPISKNINVRISIVDKSEYETNALSEWSRAMCRHYYVQYQLEMKAYQSCMIYEAAIHPPPNPTPVLHSLINAFKFLAVYNETKTALNSLISSSGSYKKYNVKFSGWPDDLMAKSFRLNFWLTSTTTTTTSTTMVDDDAMNCGKLVARMMRFKNGASWQVAIYSEDQGMWNVSDLYLSTEECLKLVFIKLESP